MTDIVIARRPASIKPSPSIAARALVTKLRADGHDIVDFTLGESDFDTPSHILDAAFRAAKAGDTRYTSSAGTEALREAIVGKLARENGIDVAAGQIVVGSGAKQLIYTAFTATLDEGDEVIVPTPYWVSYPDMVVVNGGTPVIIRCGEETGFKLTPDLLRASITPRTRWVILNSPNNPSGAVYNRQELTELAGVLEQHYRVLVMTDEIYEHFTYDGKTAASFTQVAPHLADRALVINGVSKAYAMTGWRVGYATGPLTLVRAMTLLLSQSTTCPSSVSQAAAVAALDGDQAFVREACRVYQTRRDRIVDLLDAIPGISCSRPAGAFYVFPNVSGLIGRRTRDGTVLRSDLDVSLYFLREAGVAVVDGTSYGLSPYVRISFATSLDVIEDGCARIRRAVESLETDPALHV